MFWMEIFQYSATFSADSIKQVLGYIDNVLYTHPYFPVIVSVSYGVLQWKL